jgi:hypothetical protein
MKNKEKIKQRRKEYYLKNKEKIKQYYINNKFTISDKNKVKYKKDKDKQREININSIYPEEITWIRVEQKKEFDGYRYIIKILLR